eukprot:m.433992 g.433992  ORF g.433992 m.433992 type:complete len:65 (-) comp17651_c0_seq1:33-227(-)
MTTWCLSNEAHRDVAAMSTRAVMTPTNEARAMPFLAEPSDPIGSTSWHPTKGISLFFQSLPCCQ